MWSSDFLVAFAGAAICLVALGDAQPAEKEEPASTGLIGSRAIDVNQVTGKAYAVDPARGGIVVFNSAKGTMSNVATGAGPVAVAVDAKTNKIYVANSEAGSVSVIDGNTDELAGNIAVGPLPYVLAVNSVSGKVFISNTFSDVVTVLNERDNATAKLKAGSADAIAIDEKLDRTYLLHYEDSAITILDSKPSLVGRTTTGMHLWGVAMDSGGGKLYVTRSGNGELAVLDEGSGTIDAVAVGAIPCAVAVIPENNRAYVVNHGGNSLSVVDTALRRSIATVPVGDRPQAVAVDAKANLIYVANSHSDSITVIDGGTNKILRTIATGKNPFALAVNRANGQVFVAVSGEHALQVIEAQRASH